ncbi:MAG TPA: baseplate J/gp47 family protein [Roseiflexaceae bacterium]|nr:baseplate J/gp47 family protein [Roseiflexaceae bacterium]
MMFVAQPYERFVDDLLTALTGGIIREEHQFVGVEEQYALSTPRAVAGSIKVFGQRNEAFVLFDPRTDYRFDQSGEAIAWNRDGRLPDERSYFYINYHVQEAQRRLTDRNPGSVTTTLAEAFAREFAVLHQQMDQIYRSAFVDLASGTALDQVVALLGLARKDAKFASGEVLFKRSTPAPGDIAIPAGTLVSTLDGRNFETTERRTLRRGQLAVTAPIRAQIEGPPGGVAAGAIQQINRPIYGVESVLNESQTAFATAKETDEELRRRLKGTLERAGKATVESIKYALIEDIPEITDTNIQVAERTQEAGFVEVKLGLAGSVGPDLVRRIEDSIFYARPAGVRVVHNLPTSTQLESARRAAVEQDATASSRAEGAPAQLPTEILNRQPNGGLVLKAHVLLRLAEPNLSAAQKERIEDDVRKQVVEYVEKLPMGATLIYNKILGRIVQFDQVSDAVLLLGTEYSGELLFAAEPIGQADLDNKLVMAELRRAFEAKQIALSQDVTVSVEKQGAIWQIIDDRTQQPFIVRHEQNSLSVYRGYYRCNLAADGRKATIDIENVIVGLMEEEVRLAIQVTLEIPQGRVLAPDALTQLQADLKQAGAIYTAVERTVQDVLADVKDSLVTGDIVVAVRDSLSALGTIVRYAAGQDASAPLLQLVERNAVTVNAEFRETGRLLNNTGEVRLQEHEVLKLDTLMVTLAGVL